MKTDQEIVSLLTVRKTTAAPIHARMRELERVVNNDEPIHTPGENRSGKPAVPNLPAQALEQMSMRVASTRPMPWFPAVRPGEGASERRARLRRDVTLGWWEANKLSLQRRQRARHLIGFGMAPALITYDRKLDLPRWEIRSPLDTLPAPTSDIERLTPPNVIFTYRRTLGWLLANYPDEIAFLYVGPQAKHDTLVEVIEYVDHECRKLMAIAPPRWDGLNYEEGYGRQQSVVLDESRHDLDGLCPVVIPARFSLTKDGPGAYDDVLDMHRHMQTLMALEVEAIEKGIWPDPWLEPIDANVTPEVIQAPDGRNGDVGIVRRGRIRYEQTNPSYAALQAVDRMERAVRVQAGIPPDWGGESGTNIRTGARGDAVAGATVNFHIQEHQELLAESQREEDRRAIAWDRFVGKNRVKPVNVAWKGAKGGRTYRPEAIWETDAHAVKYAIAGADAAQLNIMVSQKMGTGLMSTDTARELDPLIDDPEQEKRRILAQRLDEAAFGAIEAQAAQGTLALPDLAKVKKLILTGTSWEDAVDQVQREAQERQAQQVEPTAPEAMPGIGVPGMGNEPEPFSPIPELPVGVDRLAQVFSRSRIPSMSIPAEGVA